MVCHESIKGPDYKKNMHKYVKKKIQKNGISLKRPNVRPKHLIDCLKDPVHYEFLHRFAKAMITNIYSLMQHSRPFLINFLGLFEEVKKKMGRM